MLLPRRLFPAAVATRTNGKAERFIQTSLRELAYARAFNSSADRAAAMPLWIDTYNRRRPHSALRAMAPLSWIATRQAANPTTPLAPSDPKPRLAGVDGVRPRVATAAGGLGLTPAASAQASSPSGGNNLLGNNI
jgi:hypothetical protein